MSRDIWDSVLERWGGMGSLAASALRVLLILVAAWLLTAVLQRLIMAFRLRLQAHMHDGETQRRAETLSRVSRYLVGVVVAVIAVMLVLAEIGISVAPILGAAGVVGVAVGFGAQSLVKDYLAGFFILVENQMRLGDVVDLGGHGGVVEELTLRYIRLRDYDGHVHFVPNGEIRSVVNMTSGYSQAAVEIGVAYREDLDEALRVMRAVGEGLRAEPAWEARILEPTEMVGVESFGDSDVRLRVRFKVAAGQQWSVRREYLRRLKAAFDEHGIEIPYPHLTVYAGEGKDGSAAPFRVLGPWAAANQGEPGARPSRRDGRG